MQRMTDMGGDCYEEANFQSNIPLDESIHFPTNQLSL